MSSKTKIFVLHMKEIIYTVIFAVLGILLICMLFFMFSSGGRKNTTSGKNYTPGVYTSTVTLNNTELEVEVAVDKAGIDSIRLSNLDETISTMYPLVQPAIEELAAQICETQSLDHVELSSETPYTSQVLLGAIENALKKAAAN